MLDLNDFHFFVQIVDRGGFTAAGRTLQVPKSTLSRRIQQLEASLGVRLLDRTSRRFAMTDDRPGRCAAPPASRPCSSRCRT